MKDIIDVSDVKDVYGKIMEYVMRGSMKRACFLTKEHYMIVLACLKYCIDKLEEEDGKAKKGL